jgi:hypothetical protein
MLDELIKSYKLAHNWGGQSVWVFITQNWDLIHDGLVDGWLLMK